MAHHAVAHIETPRITLRPFHPNDGPALGALLARNRGRLALAPDRSDVLDFIYACREESELGRRDAFAVIAGGRLIGGAQLERQGDVALLGCWIDVDEAGHGHAVEAAGALAHVALVLGMARRVQVRCAADDGASVQLGHGIGCVFQTDPGGVLVGEVDVAGLHATAVGALEIAAIDGTGRALLGRPCRGPVQAWNELVTALENRFKTQLPVAMTPVTALGEPAAAFTAIIGPERSAGPQEMLRHAARLAVGAICVVDSHYVIRHVVTLGSMHIPEAVHAVVTIDHEARRLGRALARKTSSGASYASCTD